MELNGAQVESSLLGSHGKYRPISVHNNITFHWPLPFRRYEFYKFFGIFLFSVFFVIFPFYFQHFPHFFLSFRIWVLDLGAQQRVNDYPDRTRPPIISGYVFFSELWKYPLRTKYIPLRVTWERERMIKPSRLPQVHALKCTYVR